MIAIVIRRLHASLEALRFHTGGVKGSESTFSVKVKPTPGKFLFAPLHFSSREMISIH
jgi:hypothetical protein